MPSLRFCFSVRYLGLWLMLIFGIVISACTSSTSDELEKTPTIQAIDYIGSSQENPEKISAKIQSLNFEKYKNETLKKDSVYWFKIRLNNNKCINKEYFMHFNSMISHVELFQIKNDSTFNKETGGALIPFNKRPSAGYIKDKVTFRTSRSNFTTVYLRIVNAIEHHYDLSNITIISSNKYKKTVYDLNILQGIFQGMMLILLILNFILFIFSRNRLYLLYSLYIFFTSLLFLFNFQISEQYFLPKHPKADMNLLWSVYIAQFIYLLFFIELLKTENIPVWRKYVIYYARIIFVMCISILITAQIDYHSAIFISDIYTLLNALFVISTFLIFFSKVALKTQIVLTGSFIMVIGALITTITGFYQVAISNLVYYQAGVIIEVILFTIAVNYTYTREHLDRVKILYQNSILELEKVKREKENLLLKREVEQKNRMLTTEALKLGEKEQLINDTIKHLSTFSHVKLKKSDKQNIISKLKMNHSPNYWEEFEIHFNSTNPLFYKNLHKKFNNLTPNECKMCAFLKLNLSTKEIANITGKSANTIDVARGRLRKKLGLAPNDNLNTFFTQFD